VVSLSLYTLVTLTWWAVLHSFCVFGRWQFGIFARDSFSEAFYDFLQCAEEARPQLPTYFALHHLQSFYLWQLHISPVPVAARFKAWVCGRSPAEIVGSNPTEGMDVCLL